MSKTLVLPHINCVLVGAGTIRMLHLLLLNHSHEWLSFDDLLDQISEHMEDTCERFAQALPWESARVEISLCGWSDQRERFATYVVHADVSGCSVRGPEPTPQTYMKPMPDDALLAEVLGAGGSLNADELHLLMEAQRRTKFPFGREGEEPLGDGHVVGMAMEEVIIERDKITSRILKRWPDEIGKHIVLEDHSAAKAPGTV